VLLPVLLLVDRIMSESREIIAFLASIKDLEEVDLSAFEVIEESDSWLPELRRCTKMKRLKLPPSLVTIRKESFDVFKTQLKHVTLPKSLRSLEFFAFNECTGLSMNDLKIPESCEDCGSYAFFHCTGLTGKLTTHTTGYASFKNCTGLSELDLENCKVIKNDCFQGCTGLVGELKLPLSLISIGRGAFRDCTGFKGKLRLPPFLRYIDDHAFNGCTRLEGQLELPSSLCSIGRDAFYNCIGLTGPLIIPDFVSFIASHAFRGCTGMTGIPEAINKHFKRFESWKARGNVLMTLTRVDDDFRRVVEENGELLGSAASDDFLANYSKDAQLIYKAIAHVDGTDKLANGISRIIFDILPMDREDYGTM
jgi:hypothetical protein